MTATRAGVLVALALLAGGGCAGESQDDRFGGQPQASASPAKAPPVRADQLIGLTPDGVVALLGPADFRRQDGPAEIWQYRDAGCVLDLFLYPGPSDPSPRVAHVEARDRALPQEARATCVDTLLNARRGRATPSPARTG